MADDERWYNFDELHELWQNSHAALVVEDDHDTYTFEPRETCKGVKVVGPDGKKVPAFKGKGDWKRFLEVKVTERQKAPPHNEHRMTVDALMRGARWVRELKKREPTPEPAPAPADDALPAAEQPQAAGGGDKRPAEAGGSDNGDEGSPAAKKRKLGDADDELGGGGSAGDHDNGAAEDDDGAAGGGGDSSSSDDDDEHEDNIAGGPKGEVGAAKKKYLLRELQEGVKQLSQVQLRTAKDVELFLKRVGDIKELVQDSESAMTALKVVVETQETIAKGKPGDKEHMEIDSDDEDDEEGDKDEGEGKENVESVTVAA